MSGAPRFLLLFALRFVASEAACDVRKSAACSGCSGHLSASTCVCTCGLSAPERAVYAAVLFPALLMLLLYI